MSEDKFVHFNDLLGLSEIGDISLIINAPRIEASPCLFGRTSGDQHISNLLQIWQDADIDLQIALHDLITVFLKDPRLRHVG
jgi:hypothetical protein